MTVLWSAAALQDLFDIGDYHVARDPAFIELIETSANAVLGRIEDNPQMFPVVKRSIRKAPLEPTAYLLFYIVRRGGPEVVRLIHGARNWPDIL